MLNQTSVLYKTKRLSRVTEEDVIYQITHTGGGGGGDDDDDDDDDYYDDSSRSSTDVIAYPTQWKDYVLDLEQCLC
jgi:hypothetical protein